MKRDAFTLPLAFPGELIIDNFAGGGGTSTGLEAAFGRPVDIAINHDPEALAMHAINHPHTQHLCESVWDVDPIAVTRNQPVGLVWLSPDCKHFSKSSSPHFNASAKLAYRKRATSELFRKIEGHAVQNGRRQRASYWLRSGFGIGLRMLKQQMRRRLSNCHRIQHRGVSEMQRGNSAELPVQGLSLDLNGRTQRSIQCAAAKRLLSNFERVHLRLLNQACGLCKVLYEGLLSLNSSITTRQVHLITDSVYGHRNGDYRTDGLHPRGCIRRLKSPSPSYRTQKHGIQRKGDNETAKPEFRLSSIGGGKHQVLRGNY